MIRSRFSTKLHFKWIFYGKLIHVLTRNLVLQWDRDSENNLKLTFKNGLQLWQLKTSLIRFKNLKTLQAYSCRLYRKLEILILIRAYSLKSKECNLRMQKTSCFHCLFIFFKIILEMSWFLKNVLSLTNSSSSCKYFRKHGLFLLFILRSLQNQSSNR